jgi:hypothetical protein
MSDVPGSAQPAHVRINSEGASLQQIADELVNALLTTVRSIRSGDQEQDGKYTLSAELLEDGSYGWHWSWWPGDATIGGAGYGGSVH